MITDDDRQPALYGELAPWFHLLTAPSDYEIGARHALEVLTEAIGAPPQTILELGRAAATTPRT